MTKKIKTIEFGWYTPDNMDTAQNIDMTMLSQRVIGHSGDARFIAKEEWA